MRQSEMEWNGGSVKHYDTIDIPKLNELFLDYINYGDYPEVVFWEEIRENTMSQARENLGL